MHVKLLTKASIAIAEHSICHPGRPAQKEKASLVHLVLHVSKAQNRAASVCSPQHQYAHHSSIHQDLDVQLAVAFKTSNLKANITLFSQVGYFFFQQSLNQLNNRLNEVVARGSIEGGRHPKAAISSCIDAI